MGTDPLGLGDMGVSLNVPWGQNPLGLGDMGVPTGVPSGENPLKSWGHGSPRMCPLGTAPHVLCPFPVPSGDISTNCECPLECPLLTPPRPWGHGGVPGTVPTVTETLAHQLFKRSVLFKQVETNLKV